MDESERAELVYALKQADILLRLCEDTMQYPFKSRRRLAAGEVGLAMCGVIRFLNGNLEFKNRLTNEQLEFVAKMDGLMRSVGKLTPYQWVEKS